MTTTASPPAASWALPLLAGAAALVGVPLGTASFVVLARLGLEEDGVGSAVSNAWMEGGSPMYLVLGTAMVASLIIAVLITVAARASAGAAVAIPFLTAFPALAGASGTTWGLNGSIQAVAHASPEDRVTILFGSAGEALQSSMFGAGMSGGLAIAASLGLFVALIARAKDPASAQRHALLAGALVALSFAAVCFIGGAAIHEQAGTCKAIAYAAPADQLVIASAVVEQANLERAWSVSLAVALIALLAGAGAMRAPAAGRIAFGVCALLGLGLIGLGTRPHLSANFKQVNEGDEPAPPLLVFDSPPLAGQGMIIGADSVEVTQERVREAYGQWRDLRQYGREDDGTFGLSLSKELSAETLAAALEVLCEERVRKVALFTDLPTNPYAKLPPPFDALQAPSRGVQLELGTRSEQCPDGCELARLENGALALGTEKWPLVERAEVATPVLGEPVLLSLEPRAPQELLRAALTAMKQGRPLLLLSSREPRPKQVDAKPVPETPAVAPVKVELASLSVLGSLDPKIARSDFTDQIASLGFCVDGEDLNRLPLTANLEFGVDSNGRVVVTEVQGKLDDAFLDCLRTELPYSSSFSPPKTRGLSIVRAGLRFMKK